MAEVGRSVAVFGLRGVERGEATTTREKEEDPYYFAEGSGKRRVCTRVLRSHSHLLHPPAALKWRWTEEVSQLCC
jgi:hypothetical protein